MDLLSNESISGITGAILGSAASFIFGAAKEYHDTYNARATAIRRAQFSILRQTNELRDILIKIEHARHIKDRHRFIQVVPKLGILNQIKAEELDFLVESNNLSAEDLQGLDLANEAYLNARHVNDLRNRTLSAMQANMKQEAVDGLIVTGKCSVLDDNIVAHTTDNLFECLDDAITKCDYSIKRLLKAGREWRVFSETKFYDFSSTPIADEEWRRLSNSRIDFSHLSLNKTKSGCCIFDARELRASNHQSTGAAINVIVNGKSQMGVMIEADYIEANQIAQRSNVSHYYWVYKGVLSLTEPSLTRPSVKCQES